MYYHNTKKMIMAALFAALTAIGAFITIPVSALPITMQFLFTAMAGVILGSRLGALSQFIYLIVGLMGFPVFTNGGGPSYILQPSFGFLLAMIPAAYFIGIITEKKCGYIQVAIAGILGDLILYIIGVPYMYLIMHLYLGSETTITALLAMMLVYMPGDTLKIIALTVLAPSIVKSLSMAKVK